VTELEEHCWKNKIERHGMNRVCSRHGREEKEMCTKFQLEERKGRHLFADLALDVNITLKGFKEMSCQNLSFK
jgi:hypothetical protein